LEIFFTEIIIKFIIIIGSWYKNPGSYHGLPWQEVSSACRGPKGDRELTG